MFIVCAAVLAQDNEEARVKAAVEDRYRESIAAANRKDTAAMTNLYDDNAVLMPQSEEAVLGKAAIGEYYKKLFANPDFVPFTLKTNWNSFQLAGDIAIAASVFEGDATRNREAHPFPRQGPTCLEETVRRFVENLPQYVRRDPSQEITRHGPFRVISQLSTLRVVTGNTSLVTSSQPFIREQHRVLDVSSLTAQERKAL